MQLFEKFIDFTRKKKSLPIRMLAIMVLYRDQYTTDA